MQLFVFVSQTDPSKLHYGEFVDNHIMIGSPRALYVSNMYVGPITEEWRAFLHNKSLEIEYKKPGETTSSWSRRRIHGDKLQSMLYHSSGYVMPFFHSIPEFIYSCYPCMSAHPPAVMPKQVTKPPSIIAPMVAPTLPSSSKCLDDNSSQAGAIIDSDDDDSGNRERHALCSAVNKMITSSRKVGFKS